MGGGISEVGQKLKDTFMTIFKGGKAVVDWVGGGIKAFINNVLKTDPIEVKEGRPLGIRKVLTGGVKLFGLYNFFESLGFTGGKDGQVDKFPNLLNILNPFKFYPLLFKSFFGKRDESEESVGSSTATISDEDDTITTTTSGFVGSQETFGGKGGSTYKSKAGKDAEAVASETTYESGEGNAMIIPVPIQQTKTVSTGGGGRRGSGARRKTVVIDDSELAMYAGK
jgi:hypothetical protein